MHRSEAREMSECAGCGAVVDTRASSAFAFGGESVLCFDCAIERGGAFDPDQDRWVEEPRISDLARDEG